MEDAMFDLDDNWGTTEETHYPKLPAKENASKTVQKRRIKAAKKVVSMLSSAVIPAAAREVVAKEGTAVENPEGGANTSDPLTQARRKRRRGSKADSSAAALQAAEPAGGDAEEQSEGQAVNADLPEGGVAQKRKKIRRKTGEEKSEAPDPATALKGPPPPTAKQQPPSEGKASRPVTSVSSPIEIAEPGDESRGGQGGAGPRRKSHTSGLLEQMTARLSGSKFRWLNEELYTSTGEHAFKLMQGQPDLFQQYHEGFQQQTKHWPEQPLDAAIRWLKKQPKEARVADFGCGDAGLARAVSQQVASLDLVAASPEVTACDMSATPLDSGSTDVVVFCLALMGTDYPSFLKEATRVLRPGGKLWIAEVRSRFVQGGQESFEPFLTAIQGLGYRLTSQDASNKMFVIFELQRTKAAGTDAQLQWPALKPCLYKRR